MTTFIKTITLLTVCSMVMLLGCQPADTKLTSNGKVLSGEQAGSEFVIAEGDEDEKMVETIDAFNNMDVDGLWKHIADTVTFHGADGSIAPLTKEMMAGLMAGADSVDWDVKWLVPVQVKGSNQVRVLLDSHEKMYMKDGSVVDHKLFEEFVFEEGQVVMIRQWDAAASMEGAE